MVVEGNGWTDGQKWLAGVAATLLTGLLIFALTGPGGWLNPNDEPEVTGPRETSTQTPTVAVSISEFDLPFISSGDENIVVSFRISNEGSAVARGCRMLGDVSPVGDEFSVDPQSSTYIDWGVRTYGLDGNTTLTAWVSCDNGQSAPVSRETTVL